MANSLEISSAHDLETISVIGARARGDAHEELADRVGFVSDGCSNQWL